VELLVLIFLWLTMEFSVIPILLLIVGTLLRLFCWVLLICWYSFPTLLFGTLLLWSIRWIYVTLLLLCCWLWSLIVLFVVVPAICYCVVFYSVIDIEWYIMIMIMIVVDDYYVRLSVHSMLYCIRWCYCCTMWLLFCWSFYDYYIPFIIVIVLFIVLVCDDYDDVDSYWLLIVVIVVVLLLLYICSIGIFDVVVFVRCYVVCSVCCCCCCLRLYL